jgi:hypothetical protein
MMPATSGEAASAVSNEEEVIPAKEKEMEISEGAVGFAPSSEVDLASSKTSSDNNKVNMAQSKRAKQQKPDKKDFEGFKQKNQNPPTKKNPKMTEDQKEGGSKEPLPPWNGGCKPKNIKVIRFNKSP